MYIQLVENIGLIILEMELLWPGSFEEENDQFTEMIEVILVVTDIFPMGLSPSVMTDFLP